MQLDQLDYLIMEGMADMNKAPSNMERAQLNDLINSWPKYSDVVSWVASELQSVAHTEEAVNPINTQEDLPDFQTEFSGLLKELGCPYQSIMELPQNSRFDTPDKRKVLLNFLLSELQAARILHVHTANSSKTKSMNVELDESPTAKVLREIIMELGLGKPPESITPALLWNNINVKLTTQLKQTGTLDPLFEGVLSPSQWSQIEKYFDELSTDYKKRKEMLLKRLDVTVQSFHWSDRLKGQKKKEINDKFRKHSSLLTSNTNVKVSDILAARIDLPILEKTASASVRKNTKSAVNTVIIGRVPDRGGRTDEIQPPPPEMPPWQQRQGGGGAPGTSGWIQGGGGGGGSRGGGRGGGRVQGGWSDGGVSRGGQRGGGGGGRQQQGGSRGDYNQGSGGGYNNNQRQYDNRGGGGSGGYNQQQQQYDGRGGGQGGGYNNYQQQQQSYNSGGGGGYYQHDNRGDGGGGGGYYQDQQNQGGYQQHGGSGGYHQQQGGRRDDRGGGSHRGGGHRGGGRRY